MAQNNFLGIIITVLLLAAAALAIGTVINESSVSYNQSNNDTTFANITVAGGQAASIVNQTGNNFFGNKTTTQSQTAVDRMIGTAYGTILTIGNLPGVFVNIVGSLSNGLGLSDKMCINNETCISYGSLLLAGILMFIVSIALYLAVGRN